MRRYYFIAAIAILFTASVAFAQGPPPGTLVEGIGTCIRTGNCTVCDALKLLLNIAKWILGSVGGIALFFIVDGGFGLLTSAGNTEKIEGGKKKISGAVVGLLIVAGAWTLITAIIAIFAGTGPGGAPRGLFTWANPQQWSRIECQ